MTLKRDGGPNYLADILSDPTYGWSVAEMRPRGFRHFAVKFVSPHKMDAFERKTCHFLFAIGTNCEHRMKLRALFYGT